MCGIGGYIGSAGQGGPIDEAALLGQLAHRGPDHRASRHLTAADGTPVFLGFTRLAILDLSPAGHQPMSSEDGAQTIVYNGEVYNFRALREELHGRGHRFRSTSDTEVVLAGYREWGAGVIDRLRGMFAFALFDQQRQELLLCRDRLGIKPLYYLHDGRRLVFGSELRTLLASRAAKPRLDPRSVHGFLALGAVPQPATLLKGVSLLLPGHCLTVRAADGRASQPQVRRYFRLPAPRAATAAATPAAYAGAVDDIAGVLQEAVALRLVSDVPVGVLLSGGIDSTAVAALARRAEQALSLATFTLTYGAGHAESEGHEAAAMARELRTGHHEQVETPASILSRVPAFVAAIDQPSVDGLNTYLVAELVRRAGLKVALSGLGGDEVFLGYRLPRVFAALYQAGSLLPHSPASLSRLLRPSIGGLGLDRAPVWLQKGAVLLDTLATSRDPIQRARGLYALLRGLFPAPQLAKLFDRGAVGDVAGLDPAEHVRCDLPAPAGDLDPVDLVSYLEIDNYLSNTLLRDADVMSMVHGVELRVPLCDHVLVSRALSLGAAARRGAMDGRRRKKPLLVDATKSPLVEQAAARHKRGFVLPLGTFLHTDPGLRSHVGEVLEDAEAARAAGLQPTAVSRLWRSFSAGRATQATWRVWGLYILLSWTRRHGASLS